MLYSLYMYIYISFPRISTERENIHTFLMYICIYIKCIHNIVYILWKTIIESDVGWLGLLCFAQLNQLSQTSQSVSQPNQPTYTNLSLFSPGPRIQKIKYYNYDARWLSEKYKKKKK